MLAAGLEYELDADWSVENTSNAGNNAAGLFCFILDGATIQCQSAGPIAAHAWLYGRLSARFTVPTTGMHELGIRITRPWRIADATLTDSVDNVTLSTAATCYPNCDGSTEPPILNVNDFACFLNAFAAGRSYANCDGSTAPPALNVNDFGCFLNHFAAGCP